MNYLMFVIIILIPEIILTFMFSVIAKVVYKKIARDFRSIFKGLNERKFLIIGLITNYPHALTFFSALRLGTHLKHTDSDENEFNDFYLIGNLISVLVAIVYITLF